MLQYKAIEKENVQSQLELGSIVSYPDRGKYGKSSYRGNCSGRLITDLLTLYKPKQFLECFAGSGTGRDAARSLGITNSVHLDLNPTFGGHNLLLDEMPIGYDFCFSHPPYWDIIKYSNEQWDNGGVPHEGDISHTVSYEEFIKQIDKINLKIYQSLANGGRHAFLMGDVRRKGKIYSVVKDMQYFGDLTDYVIKVQHNTHSSRKKYENAMFIPIAHEHLLIFRKRQIWKVSITVVKTVQKSLKDSLFMTWRDLIFSALEEIGGQATLNEIYQIIQDTAKAKQNKHWKEKIRQTLQIHQQFSSVCRGTWKINLVVAA